jgi:hypothetical protein
VEHEAGFRAEFAYPKTLYLLSEALPVTLKEIQTRIQTLIGYGCDLFVSEKSSNVPLWRKQAGLDAAGLDFLMSRSQEWYARRKQERTIRRGDRIAVLGRGIAIVEQVTHEYVAATLWNRTTVIIGRRNAIWNDLNSRWETVATAFLRN